MYVCVQGEGVKKNGILMHTRPLNIADNPGTLPWRDVACGQRGSVNYKVTCLAGVCF